MQRKAYRRKLFNDQANKLLCQYPDMRDEVTWRMVHLNSKWETLEQAITPCKSNPNQLDMCTGNNWLLDICIVERSILLGCDAMSLRSSVDT